MNIQDRIAKLEEELAQLKVEAAKPRKWEPMSWECYVSSTGNINYGSTLEKTRDYGVEFHTEQQANAAARMFRSYHRLINYVLQKEPDWDFTFTRGELNYYVYVSEETGDAGYDCHKYYKHAGLVYMPKHVAGQLAHYINNGVFEL